MVHSALLLQFEYYKERKILIWQHCRDMAPKLGKFALDSFTEIIMRRKNKFFNTLYGKENDSRALCQTHFIPLEF